MEAFQLQKGKYTKEEYLSELRKSEHKLEYIDGVIRMMAGGSRNHNRIAKNAFRSLDGNPKGCEVLLSDTAVAISEASRYYFPDLSAVCEQSTTTEEGLEKVTNPCLIIEVLSEGTVDADRSEKFHAYRQLESFKEYILIDSRNLSIETFYKESNRLWIIRSYFKSDQEVEIRTLNLNISVGTFYKCIDLASGHS